MWSDRIKFKILWNEFVPGTSIFIPCMDPKRTIAAFKKEIPDPTVSYVYRVVVEDNVQGLRIWRT